VYVNEGTFTMSGGTISGNTANDNGGGVYVYDNSTFIMSGGEISGNTSSYNGGGGVCVYDNSTFTMSGGTISGNTSSYSGGGGGGVFVGDKCTFTMNNGTISGNTTASYGGGVFVVGRFTMNGGEIRGNTANDNGGGVYVSDGSFIKYGGGIIYGSNATDTLKNTATTGDGHAAYVYLSFNSNRKRNTTAGESVTLNSESSSNWN
jgi:parallel beta-helix repeat protein